MLDYIQKKYSRCGGRYCDNETSGSVCEEEK